MDFAIWRWGKDHLFDDDKSCYYYAQVVVEKKIMREKQLTRHDLGREKFIEEAC